MLNFPLPRIDNDEKLRDLLLKYCRLNEGEFWQDPQKKHKVGCIDAANENQIKTLLGKQTAALAVHDPPYNFVAFQNEILKILLPGQSNGLTIPTTHCLKNLQYIFGLAQIRIIIFSR